jgi:DNA-binding transcriptional ArsR family regulator
MEERNQAVAEAAGGLTHPTKVRVLHELAGGKASPAEIAERCGERIGNVAYHVRQLHSAGYLQKAGTRPVRGMSAAQIPADVAVDVVKAIAERRIVEAPDEALRLLEEIVVEADVAMTRFATGEAVCYAGGPRRRWGASGTCSRATRLRLGTTSSVPPMRMVGYVRVSTVGQEQNGASLDAQQAAIEQRRAGGGGSSPASSKTPHPRRP